MSTNSLRLRVGTRSSRLAIVQTKNALKKISDLLPVTSFEIVPMSSPGDEDRITSLEVSDPDFFTRYLDRALENGELDCAIHSAKDLPEELPKSIEWFWLPWREDPKDVIVLGNGKNFDSLPPKPKIGISSDRRRRFCEERFPNAMLLPVRGNIEERIAQLDEGKYDVLIMAAAALIRLSAQDRISEWISLSDLSTPEGQGYLAIAYRSGDRRIHRLRSLFVNTVVFVGGGPGNPDHCTIAGLKALQACDVCIYDALAPQELVKKQDSGPLMIDAGKRRGRYKIPRDKLDQLLVDLVRKGKKIVRLKGGDPGLYGRLAEETGILNQHNLPYRVIPGVSSLNAATTGTGLLLTRRGISRGFTVITPWLAGNRDEKIGPRVREQLPLVFFMALCKTQKIVDQLLKEGRNKTEPAAIVLGASTHNQSIIGGCLANIAHKVEKVTTDLPGILIVGQIAETPSYAYKGSFGALQGKRVLVTSSAALQEQAEKDILTFGGIPLRFPLIRLDPSPEAKNILTKIGEYDWIVLTSPSAVFCLIPLLRDLKMDLRAVSKILVSGPGVSRALGKYGLKANAGPTKEFGAKTMLQVAKKVIKPNHKVLRLRSQLAGKQVEEALIRLGAIVTDCVLYKNSPIPHSSLPSFDFVFFASSSAVKTFIEQWGLSSLEGKVSIAIGKPTASMMASYNLPPTIVSQESSATASIQSLAAYCVNEELKDFVIDTSYRLVDN